MLNSNNSADSAVGSIYKLYGFVFPNISHSKNYLSFDVLQWEVLLTILTDLFVIRLNLLQELSSELRF